MEWNGKNRGTNHPYLQPVAELRRTQINVVKSNGILKAPSAATIRQLTTDHSSDLGIDFREGGRKTGEPREKPSKHGRDQLQQLYSHELQVFLESTRGYTQVVTHPAITPVRPGFNLKFSGERRITRV